MTYLEEVLHVFQAHPAYPLYQTISVLQTEFRNSIQANPFAELVAEWRHQDYLRINSETREILALANRKTNELLSDIVNTLNNCKPLMDVLPQIYNLTDFFVDRERNSHTLNPYRGLPWKDAELPHCTPYDRICTFLLWHCLESGERLPLPPVNLDQRWEKVVAEMTKMLLKVLPENTAGMYPRRLKQAWAQRYAQRASEAIKHGFYPNPKEWLAAGWGTQALNDILKQLPTETFQVSNPRLCMPFGEWQDGTSLNTAFIKGTMKGWLLEDTEGTILIATGKNLNNTQKNWFGGIYKISEVATAEDAVDQILSGKAVCNNADGEFNDDILYSVLITNEDITPETIEWVSLFTPTTTA